jgi:hypothetical protein
MKISFIVLTILSCLSHTITGFSQSSDESVIRKREDMERQAILKSDTVQLSQLMSKQIVVQNPENVIVGFQQILNRIKTGKINYASFERRIDNSHSLMV